MTSKICSCKTCPKKGQLQPLADFRHSRYTPDGLEYYCRVCKLENQRKGRAKRRAQAIKEPLDFDIDVEEPDPAAERAERRHEDAQRRLQSEYEPIKPGDLGKKDDYRAPNYDREKKQEFNATMGELMDFARGQGGDEDKLAKYVSLLSEQESRWMNKRQARIHALTHAREMLLARRFELIATALKWPATFGQYSQRTKIKPPKRTVNVLLTDLHFGAKLPGDENPVPFGIQEANRRLAYVMQQAGDYKTQYREQSRLNLLFAGDTIEGNLLHGTQLDQDPTPVQLVAFARAMYSSIAYAAARYPTVDVWAIAGNHGRDKLMHHGRALSSRQYNFERAIAVLVADRCKHLTNVTFHIPKAAVAVVPLYDKVLLVLHGDAEAKLKAPSASGGHASFQAAIDKFNAEKVWAPRCDILAVGHFHDPALMPFDTGIGLCNGPLLPPSGYARAGGYRGPCGQWLWESVEGFALGDSRYVRVGQAQDADARLDEIIPTMEW